MESGFLAGEAERQGRLRGREVYLRAEQTVRPVPVRGPEGVGEHELAARPDADLDRW